MSFQLIFEKFYSLVYSTQLEKKKKQKQSQLTESLLFILPHLKQNRELTTFIYAFSFALHRKGKSVEIVQNSIGS